MSEQNNTDNNQANSQDVPSETVSSVAEEQVSVENQNVEKTTVKEDEVKFDSKKWLYAFDAKINNELKKFYILKPGRKLKQNGELEYAKQLARFVKAGLLPKAAWSTILDNSGGTISDSEAETYTGARNKFFELTLELNKLKQQDKTEEVEKQIDDVMFNIEIAKNQIQSFELEQVYIFENTAEAKARNATIEWWLCTLAYINENEPFFKGNTVDEKLDWYDELNAEENKELLTIAQRFSYLITLWFLNRIESPQQFKEADLANVSKMA